MARKERLERARIVPQREAGDSPGTRRSTRRLEGKPHRAGPVMRLRVAARVSRVAVLLLAVVVLAAGMLRLAAPPAASAAEDWDLPGGGHFFTQTGGGGGKGYSITNEGGVAMWSEFNRLGGVQAVGYPISQRFQWNGFTSQAMQRVVFQWRPDQGVVNFINVFDMMSDAGKDDWLLSTRQTPKPLPAAFDAGLDWDAKVAKRLALLDDNPAIKAMYYSVTGDAIQMNGLPTSPITDMGNNFTIRAQRIVIQQWKVAVPWASAGQVTVALGGSIAGEAGILPNPGALIPITDPGASPPPTVSPTATAPAGPTATPTPTVPPVKKVAFVSSRDGNYEIYTMYPDGTNLTRVTNSGATDQEPEWSPDGTRILFVSNRDGNYELYTMNPDGTAVTRLTTNGAADISPAWSKDGTKIAFASNRDNPSFEIYTMNASGSGVTRITTHPAGNRQPSWSPDGTRIAFVSHRDGHEEIYTMNADGTGLTRLTTTAVAVINLSPVWSPDGTRITFMSTRDGNQEVYLMNADGSGVTRLTNNPANDFSPAWSGDGAKILFTSHRDGNNEVYVMNGDGSGVTRLTNHPGNDEFPVAQP